LENRIPKTEQKLSYDSRKIPKKNRIALSPRKKIFGQFRSIKKSSYQISNYLLLLTNPNLSLLISSLGLFCIPVYIIINFNKPHLDFQPHQPFLEVEKQSLGVQICGNGMATKLIGSAGQSYHS
jgi:hypothetical protein